MSFFLLTEINYNIHLCYEFESFPQKINMKVSFNKRYLQEHVYKKHNNYVESKLNLRENQDITLI